MKGTVKGFNASRTRVAVLTDYGYTVFDMNHGSVQLEDIITGELDDHGSQQLVNQTSKTRLDVYVEAIQATEQAARQLLQP